MVFKRFNISIIIHVILLSVTCFLFIWSLGQAHLQFAKFTFAGFFIAQTVVLILYIQNFNKRFYHFMELLKNPQLMERFNSLESETSQKKIHQIYNEILNIISDVKIEKEIERQYFQHIFKIIGTSIISYKTDGKIDLINDAALNLLKLNNISSLDDMAKVYPAFVDFLREVENGDKKIFKLKAHNDILVLSVFCSVIKLRESHIKTISFQNIKPELENEELEAWQKLISVLRHEIMNSITPINSLTGTVIRLLSNDGTPKDLKQLSDGKIEKAVDSLLAIEKRNQGLLKFVESYRNLTKIPKPVIAKISLKEFFESIHTLLIEKLNSLNIQFEMKVEPIELELMADEKLLSQVLINLLNNSIDALENIADKQIQLKAFNNNSSVIIQVEDNGCGISSDQIDKIFIPFFTTKDEGNGIGLSISKQIISLHQGAISLDSKANSGTVATIVFKSHLS